MYETLTSQTAHDKIQTKKPFKKKTWKQAQQQTHLCCIKCVGKFCKLGSRNPFKIAKNPSPDPTVFYCCSFGFPGCLQVAKIAPQDPKMDAAGLPNNNFGHEK